MVSIINDKTKNEKILSTVKFNFFKALKEIWKTDTMINIFESEKIDSLRFLLKNKETADEKINIKSVSEIYFSCEKVYGLNIKQYKL